MRDHRAAVRRLRSRWLRRQRMLPWVSRVFAAAPAPRFTSVRKLHAHVHNHIALSSTTTALHTTQITGRVPTAPRALLTIERSLRTVVRLEARRCTPAHVTDPSAVRAMQRDVTAPPAVSATVTARREITVPAVARVLPRPAPSTAAVDETPSDRTPFQWQAATPQPVAKPAAATSPAELATITNHVLTEIDRRLIAHNERLGRG